MRELYEEHRLLVACIGISSLLLIAFSTMQYYGCKILELEWKWLTIAGVPLLVALFGGGYITRFKGFGVELESKLKSPVKAISLKAKDAITDVKDDIKDSIGYLSNMSEDKIKQTKILRFISGKRNYYAEYAVLQYFDKLRYLEYVAVTKEAGEFICLIPMHEFTCGNDEGELKSFSRNKISEFIHAIELNTVATTYHDICIRLTIKQNESLIASLQKLKDNNSDTAVIVNSKKQFVGLLTEREIEHRIAEDVLSTQRGNRSQRIAANRQ